jgi:hypothetical protein
MYKILILVGALAILSCKEQSKNSASPAENKNAEKRMPVEANNGNGAGASNLEEAFKENIARAHHKSEFLKHPAIAFDLDLNFNGKDRFDARITILTNSAKTHMDKPDGSSLVFTGKNAYLSPKTAINEDARFNMFTWPYFFGLPYKLKDQGAKLKYFGKKQLEGKELETYKLTFASGTGHTSNDWYIIYLNKDHTIHAAAYIVTFGGKEQSIAEENPHCIVYGDYAEVQGVPIATSWKFYNWSETEGLEGEPIGEATLTNMNFTDPRDNLFAEPQSATLIE